MFNKTKTVITTAALLVATMQAAQANPINSVTITGVGYGGNGCKGGTADVVISADKKSVSVLFDEYIAEAGGPGNRKLGRMKCDIAFALKLPQGLSVSLVDADYRGFVDLPQGAKASFTRDYFFAGNAGPTLKKNWSGGTSDDYLIQDRLNVFANVWSPCGKSALLRSKTAATVRVANRNSEAMMTVDSVDMRTRTVFRYGFRYKSC